MKSKMIWSPNGAAGAGFEGEIAQTRRTMVPGNEMNTVLRDFKGIDPKI